MANNVRFALLLYTTACFLFGWWDGLLLLCLFVPKRSGRTLAKQPRVRDRPVNQRKRNPANERRPARRLPALYPVAERGDFLESI
jgi:hypothetical protein